MEKSKSKVNEDLKQKFHDVDQPEPSLGVNLPNKCTNCSTPITSVNADICEHCGDWLLQGQCNFCYSPIEPGQRFCGFCGNSPEGVHCSKCGITSHFDFCPNCNVPLTDQATQICQALINDPMFRVLVGFQEPQTSLPPLSDNSKDGPPSLNSSSLEAAEKAALRKYKEICQKPISPHTKSRISTQDLEVNGADLKRLAETKEEAEKEQNRIAAQQKRDAEAVRVAAEAKQRRFLNNQEARRFYGALKILLPKVVFLEKEVEKRVCVGWRCNYAGVIHAGPFDCAGPSEGGEWLYDIKSDVILVKDSVLVEEDL